MCHSCTYMCIAVQVLHTNYGFLVLVPGGFGTNMASSIPSQVLPVLLQHLSFHIPILFVAHFPRKPHAHRTASLLSNLNSLQFDWLSSYHLIIPRTAMHIVIETELVIGSIINDSRLLNFIFSFFLCVSRNFDLPFVFFYRPHAHLSPILRNII